METPGEGEGLGNRKADWGSWGEHLRAKASGEGEDRKKSMGLTGEGRVGAREGRDVTIPGRKIRMTIN